LRTQVFAYRGIVGIQSSCDAEGLLNKPKEKGQLGFVVDASYVDISSEALDLIKKVKKSCDCIGDIDVYKSSNCIVFSWLGRPWEMFKPELVSGSREFNPDLLRSRSGVLPDPGFVQCVDKLLLEENTDKVAQRPVVRNYGQLFIYGGAA